MQKGKEGGSHVTAASEPPNLFLFASLLSRPTDVGGPVRAEAPAQSLAWWFAVLSLTAGTGLASLRAALLVRLQLLAARGSNDDRIRQRRSAVFGGPDPRLGVTSSRNHVTRVRRAWRPS